MKKIKCIFEKEFPDDIHGDTIEEILMDIGAANNMDLKEWG